LLSLKCPSFYSFSEEEKEEECEQLSLSESVTRSSSGNTSSELASNGLKSQLSALIKTDEANFCPVVNFFDRIRVGLHGQNLIVS
jgi:hypothetical protein